MSSVAEVDGVPVAYRVQGQGPAVILVNGTAALDVHWGSVISDLSRQRTVITLDYAGSGGTPGGGAPLTLEMLADQVAGVAAAAGVEQFDLVGHSLGAAVSAFLAANSPHLVRSAVLVAGFPWGGEPRLKLQFQLWLDLIRTNRPAFLRMLLMTGLTPGFVSMIGVETIDGMVEGYVPVANWEGMARQVELDMALDIRELVHRVACPTLVVAGTHDQIVPQARALADLIPHANFAEVPAGHLVYSEAAAEFVALADDFLM